VLSAAREARPRPVIIHVRNNGDPGDPDEPQTDGWEFAVLPALNEPVIDKFENNAFEKTGLAALVPEDAHVTVVGMQSEYCIRATCSAALARGNKVELVRGAHATYDVTQPDPGEEAKEARQVEQDIELELERKGVKLIEVGDATFRQI